MPASPTTRPVPSVPQVMKVDRATALAVTIIGVALLFGFLARFVGKLPMKRRPGQEGSGAMTEGEISATLWIVAILVVLFAIAAVYRIVTIRGAFRDGTRLQADVLQVLDYKGGAKQVKLGYTLNGAPHESLLALGRNSLCPDEGDQVEVVVDPKKPKEAYLVEAFLGFEP